MMAFSAAMPCMLCSSLNAFNEVHICTAVSAQRPLRRSKRFCSSSKSLPGLAAGAALPPAAEPLVLGPAHMQ